MAETAHLPSHASRLVAHYPVVIIGGGINGCGLFRDLCAQGIDCLLLEKNDFCSGASAAPSRLIHGGIKYLETGEFRLVRQSARERNLLLKNAPHYVKPLETVLPVYSWLGGIIPSIRRFFGMKTSMNDRGAIIIEIGLLLYDLFGRHFRTMPNHRMLFKNAALRAMPDLTARIVAAGIYYEARITHAERLGMELVKDGIAAHPSSLALNHITLGTPDERDGLVFIDDITGKTHTASADLIVNAGGAWIDKVNGTLGIASRHMGGNKGSHLVVQNTALYDALKGRMIYFGTADGRVNLLYPFMGNVLVGSTDIPVDNPDLVACDSTERDYLASVTREVFPDIVIRPEQILLTYCGVRPLPRSDGIDPGLVSRDHSIAEDHLARSGKPVFSLIGGKWTTYRGFSEEVADMLLGKLGRSRKISTEDLAIGGGRDYPVTQTARATFVSDLAREFGIGEDRAGALIDRYGTQARDIASWTQQQTDTPLESLPDYGCSELAWIIEHELVGTLDDLLFRRTDIALSGRLDREVIRETGALTARVLQWDDTRLAREIAASEATAARHAIDLTRRRP